jgi:hypothetical protein
MVTINTPPKVDDGELQCPHCGGGYLHHGAVTIFSRPEEDAESCAIEVEGRSAVLRENASGNPSLRRDGLAVRFWCELCPIILELTLAQHKGVTLVEWRTLGRRMTDGE